MKTVMITGASKGIGAQTACEFAKNGYNVVINYNSSEKEAEHLKEYIENTYHNKVITIQCDISDEQSVQRMVKEAYQVFGRIDCLINNAGISIDTVFDDKTAQNFKKILDVNLVGTFLVSKYVGAIMMEQKTGKIVNVSSANGIDTGYVESLDYDASKAGVISLTHNLAKHFAPYVNVNCVCPGWVDTAMSKDLDPDFKQQEEDKIFLKRFAKPEEIASVIYFLCSDGASYIDNAIIRIDGGF